MENIQRRNTKDPTTITTPKRSTSLSGPLTWILALVMLIVLAGTIRVVFADSPAAALRNYFKLSFEGKYEQAWAYIQEGSEYQKLKVDLKTFSDTWERSKNHGTEYINIRIDGVLWDVKAPPGVSQVEVRYTIMAREEQAREKDPGSPEKGIVKTKTTIDDMIGDVFLEKKDGGLWQIFKARW